MANLLSYGWTTDRTTSSISVDANSSYVDFRLKKTYKSGKAKACIEIDASKYSTIYFSYERVSHSGITSLRFGVFDNMDPDDKSGIIVIDDSDFDRDNGGSASVNISDLSGTKYVGLRFTANTNDGNTCKEKTYINYLTATERGYTLTYDANGGSRAPDSVSNITSTTISSTKPTRSGYDFLGWSTSSSATSASYVAGNSISLSSNTTLYAVWKKKTYTVTYDANGGSGAPEAQTKTYGTALTLSDTQPTKDDTSADSYAVTLNANGGTCSSSLLYATRTTSYNFSEWNTNSSGTGTSYNSGASYTTNKDLSLYAIYTSNTSTDSVTLPTPTREGYEFLGWAETVDDSSGITGEYSPNGDIVLYAIWKPMGLVYICDQLEGFGQYQVLIRDSSGWNQYIPFIYTYSGWEIYSG